MKLALLFFLSCFSAFSQVVITNVYLNVGNEHNIFIQTLEGMDTNSVYLWQSSTNLSGDWLDEKPPFEGKQESQTFFFLTDSNVSVEFFRVLTVGQIAKNNSSFDGWTTNLVTCYTNIICFTNCVSCLPTNPPPFPP